MGRLVFTPRDLTRNAMRPLLLVLDGVLADLAGIQAVFWMTGQMSADGRDDRHAFSACDLTYLY